MNLVLQIIMWLCIGIATLAASMAFSQVTPTLGLSCLGSLALAWLCWAGIVDEGGAR